MYPGFGSKVMFQKKNLHSAATYYPKVWKGSPVLSWPLAWRTNAGSDLWMGCMFDRRSILLGAVVAR